MQARRFSIRIPDAEIEDLRRRLGSTRAAPVMRGTGWSEGIDSDYLSSLVDYWKDSFDWRAQEAKLNEVPHYLADVGGQAIHFIHEKGRGPRPFPLIVTHGWPGSFAEMGELVQLLTHPQRYGGVAEDAFDVVVPSLPGFAFSPAPESPGTGPFEVATLWAGLMQQLGYPRYGVQGGDWGASVSTWLAFLQPSCVAGIHLNFIPGSFRPPLGEGAAPLSEEEAAFLERAAQWAEQEGAYAMIQGTKPQTLATALNDSPAGLAAWIAEKFHAWSDTSAHGARAISMDALLTNISLYWFTECAASSFRMYVENRRRPVHFLPGQRVLPPLGVAHFPAEIPLPPRSWVERVFTVNRWTRMPGGGHFAAMERPAELAGEIRAFFRPLRAQ
ncbi:MAG: epoxide hydrolase family protein [Pseudomonadota bacterium]